MSRWAQDKKQHLASTRLTLLRAGHLPDEFEEASAIGRIASVEQVITSIPANIIAQRAIECGSYARALFHWENYIRENKDNPNLQANERENMYERLQSIYSEIDEPDGLDGIAASINFVRPEQEALQHVRAGRWSAAQGWYEVELASKPDDHDLQTGLLTCLQQSGNISESFGYVCRSSTDKFRPSSTPC